MSVPNAKNKSKGQRTAMMVPAPVCLSFMLVSEYTAKCIYQPPALVYSLDDFENDLSNLLFQAFTCRSSEHHLYPLYNHILTLTCLDLRHPNNARVSLSCSPQALFGSIPQLSETGNGVTSSDTSDGGETRGKAAKKKKKVQKKANEGEEDDSRDLPPKQLPDFARLLVFSDRDEHLARSWPAMTCGIADFFELKPLNCGEHWSTDEAKTAARNVIKSHLTQVYDSAMAGFAYNPGWKRLYALLIIGGYFTQLYWKKRPNDDVLKPVLRTEVPASIKEGVDYRELIGKVVNEISFYEARREENALPEMLYHNEPVFSYEPGGEGADHRRASLSSVFIFALSSPIKTGFPELSRRSSMFEPPAIKPKLQWGMKVSIDAYERHVHVINVISSLQAVLEAVVKDALIATPVDNLMKVARSLGHRFAEDPAPSPTPPNSTAEHRFTGTVKGVKNLPKPHIQTRLQKASLLSEEDGDVEALEAPAE